MMLISCRRAQPTSRVPTEYRPCPRGRNRPSTQLPREPEQGSSSERTTSSLHLIWANLDCPVVSYLWTTISSGPGLGTQSNEAERTTSSMPQLPPACQRASFQKHYGSHAKPYKTQTTIPSPRAKRNNDWNWTGSDGSSVMLELGKNHDPWIMNDTSQAMHEPLPTWEVEQDVERKGKSHDSQAVGR